MAEEEKDKKDQKPAEEVKAEEKPEEKKPEEDKADGVQKKGEGEEEKKEVEKPEEKTEGKEEPDKLKEEGKEEEKKEGKEEEKPEEETKKTEGDNKPATETEEKKPEEKKKKGFKLPFLGKKDKVTGKDAVDVVDPEAKEDLLSVEERLAKRIDEQINKAHDEDYFVVRFKKNVTLAILGLILLSLWLVPISKYLMEKYYGDAEKVINWQKITSIFRKKTAEGDDADTKESQHEERIETKIRIRNGNEDEAGANELVEILKQAGYINVEVAQDTESEFEGVSVAVKKDAEELRNSILTVVGQKYNASSASAELTEDSDFEVVILFRPEN